MLNTITKLLFLAFLKVLQGAAEYCIYDKLNFLTRLNKNDAWRETPRYDAWKKGRKKHHELVEKGKWSVPRSVGLVSVSSYCHLPAITIALGSALFDHSA